MTETPGVGVLLRRFRRAGGLSQEALAERAGLSSRGISDIERGLKARPYVDTLQRLADALELSSSDRDLPPRFQATMSRARSLVTGPWLPRAAN